MKYSQAVEIYNLKKKPTEEQMLKYTHLSELEIEKIWKIRKENRK